MGAKSGDIKDFSLSVYFIIAPHHSTLNFTVIDVIE
jgi:hypothetical protein